MERFLRRKATCYRKDAAPAVFRRRSEVIALHALGHDDLDGIDINEVPLPPFVAYSVRVGTYG